jgi:hypothetical protein
MNFDIIKDNILALQDKYDNAVAVMGGAYWAAQEVHNDAPDFAKFVEYLSNMIHDLKFFGWHEPIPKAMRTFCHLAMVDPALVEVYIGMKFEEVCVNA